MGYNDMIGRKTSYLCKLEAFHIRDAGLSKAFTFPGINNFVCNYIRQIVLWCQSAPLTQLEGFSLQ